jgi:hypothetical protein
VRRRLGVRGQEVSVVEPAGRHVVDQQRQQWLPCAGAVSQDTVLAASSMLERVASDPHDPVAGLAAELMLCARHGWGSFVHDGTIQHRSDD